MNSHPEWFLNLKAMCKRHAPKDRTSPKWTLNSPGTVEIDVNY